MKNVGVVQITVIISAILHYTISLSTDVETVRDERIFFYSLYFYKSGQLD